MYDGKRSTWENSTIANQMVVELTRLDYPPDDVLKFSLRSPSCPVLSCVLLDVSSTVMIKVGSLLDRRAERLFCGLYAYTQTAAAAAAASVSCSYERKYIRVILFFLGCSPCNVIICMPTLLIMSGSGPCLIPRHRRLINCQPNLPK